VTIPIRLATAPRKRFRGQRRYYRRLHRDAERVRLSPSRAWWSLWHHHVDWTGWSNLGWAHRREHLKALAAIFRTVAWAGRRSGAPFQTWITVDLSDGGEDAVYFHTPNPRSAFPFELSGAGLDGDAALDAARAYGDRWAGPILEALTPLLPGLQLRAVTDAAVEEGPGGEGEMSILVFVAADGIGLPIR
jgi:hypothetical protein